MSNPLLDKYEEIYGKKEEPKKVPEDFKTKLKEFRDTSTIPSVATLNTPITPNKKLTSYDLHSGEDSFLQIAEKVKNKDARVTSVSIERDMSMIGITTVTFEVQVFT